jgi:hypothetical protein
MKLVFKILYLLILLAGMSVVSHGQAIQGAHGERTEVIWDGNRPLVIRHLDSLGNKLSLKAYAYPDKGIHPSQVTFYQDDRHWERRSYTYSGDEVRSVAVYGPSGRRDSVSMDRVDTSAFRRAIRTALPQAPDPAAEWKLALEGSRLCAQDPLLSPDPLDGNDFLFAADGRFLSRVRGGQDGSTLFLWQGDGTPPIAARFADPEYDPSHVGPGSRAVLVPKEYVNEAMDICGAAGAAHKGLFPGCCFLLKNSSYGGALDFAARPDYGISSGTYYLTYTEKEGTVAHNHFNFGNFLWGASAREMGVPLWVACLGSHFNNFFLSPDSRFHLDAADDILSITAGHHWLKAQRQAPQY